MGTHPLEKGWGAASSGAPAWLPRVVAVLVFLFPVVVATTHGGGSYVYLALLLLGLIYGRGWHALERWERWLLAGFLLTFLAMTLSLLHSEDVREGVKWLERYLRIGLVAPIYLLFRRYGLRMGAPLAAGAAVAGVVMAGQALYQVCILEEGTAGGYYNQIVFSDLAVLWGALGAVLLVTVADGWRMRLVLGVAVACAAFASILSGGRGGWLFLPLLLALLGWFCRRQLIVRWPLTLTALVVLLVLSVAASRLPVVDQRLAIGLEDLQTFVHDPAAFSSLGVRLNLWRNSVLLWQREPLLGTGLGDFHREMQRMAADGTSWSPAVAQYGHAHSIYFEALANAGMLGFVTMTAAYLVVPLLLFGRGLRTAQTPWERYYALGGVVAVLAFATFGLSEALWDRNPFVNSYVVCMVVLLAGLTRGAVDQVAPDGWRASGVGAES